MAPRKPEVLKRAVLWLLFLGPFFFASYGLANWLTSQRGDVGSLVFDWERGMPLWPWTILPYWSIDLLYGLSLLLPRDKRELDTHCLRLLSAQVLSVTCFLLFPLRFTFERPELGGVFGWLFDVLMGFDKPYNQAPSLHIALLVVLWVCYARYASGAWRWLLHGWFALIGLSVLTTWQHHFIDVPTGALAGWLCVWLWPQAQPAPFARASLSRDRTREAERDCSKSQGRDKDCVECPPSRGEMAIANNGKGHSMSDLSARYQQWVTNFPFPHEWFWSGTWWDGFDEPRCTLLEAKANYAFLFVPLLGVPRPWARAKVKSDLLQKAEVHSDKARPTPPVFVEWHFLQRIVYEYCAAEYLRMGLANLKAFWNPMPGTDEHDDYQETRAKEQEEMKRFCEENPGYCA